MKYEYGYESYPSIILFQFQALKIELSKQHINTILIHIAWKITVTEQRRDMAKKKKNQSQNPTKANNKQR